MSTLQGCVSILKVKALLVVVVFCLALAQIAHSRYKWRGESIKSAVMCRIYGFSPWQSHGRKVFDLVLFHNELDWLEIRLHTLSDQVDYFVILESTTSFTGHTKDLHLEKHWDRFQQFHEKIIYHKVKEDARQHVAATAWSHEADLRNGMLSVLPSLEAAARARKGDVIMVSDVDEIPKPGTVQVLRSCDYPRRVTLYSEFYYYAFQWRHLGGQWSHPQATTYGGSIDTTIPPEALRRGYDFGTRPEDAESADMMDAAWHCSSCFDEIAKVQEKIRSFSHIEYNTPQNNNPRTIIDRYRRGSDLFGRPGELYGEVSPSDVPAYITEQHELHGRFGYLLNRTDEHAGFLDV